MQLTTKSFLKFTSVFLCCANVKEQVLSEVAFLVLAYAPHFQAHWFAQRVARHGGKVTSIRGVGDMSLQGKDVDEQALFWCLFVESDTDFIQNAVSITK